MMPTFISSITLNPQIIHNNANVLSSIIYAVVLEGIKKVPVTDAIVTWSLENFIGVSGSLSSTSGVTDVNGKA